MVRMITYVVDEAETSGTSEEESTLPVVPAETGDKGRKGETHEDDQVEVPPKKGKRQRLVMHIYDGSRRYPLVLPLDDGVSREVRDISGSDLASRLDEHPSDVRVPETWE